MSSIRFALLSLLARQPLSGYDIKLQMNGQITPFWKVGSNQVYPELSKMESEGLVKLQGIEQNTYRPARKVYEITDNGRAMLTNWTLESEPDNTESIRDDFLLKAFNAWLVNPVQFKQQAAEMKQKHEAKLAEYLQIAEGLQADANFSKADDPVVSVLSVLEFGIMYERLYIDWCHKLMDRMEGFDGEKQS